MILEEHIGSIAKITYSQATYVLLDISGEVIRINFIRKKAFYLVKDGIGVFEIISKHPLLFDYNEPWATTYINSPAAKPAIFLQKMKDAIDNLTRKRQSWVNYIPKGYLPNREILSRNLTEGNGFLLRAPMTITDAITLLCEREEIQTKTFISEARVIEHKLLLVGDCFVIAKGFREDIKSTF
jgi:hypothetical protein